MSLSIKHKHGQFCSINYKVLVATHPDISKDERSLLAQHGPIVTPEIMAIFDDVDLDRKTFKWIYGKTLTSADFTLENMHRWISEAQAAKQGRLVRGDYSNTRGKFAEDTVLGILTYTPGVRAVRKGTKQEDTKGIDIVAETDVGTIRVQVKSNRTRCRRFRQKHKDATFAVIRVDHDNHDNTVRNVRREIARVRALLRSKASLDTELLTKTEHEDI